MKNTILFSLLLLMTFSYESAFARSDEKVIIKTERVGNDTAEWSYIGKKDLILVSFIKQQAKVIELEKKSRKIKNRNQDGLDIILHSPQGVKSQDSIKTLFLESLAQEQISVLSDVYRRVKFLISLDENGRVIQITYILPAKVEGLVTSENLYQIAKEIKKKVRFDKPSVYRCNYASYTLGRIRKDEFERYLKKE